MTLGLMIYNQATLRYHYGYSNAVGVILLVMGLLTLYTVSRIFRTDTVTH